MAGEYNVYQKGMTRFALSEQDSFLVVSKKYLCCNPNCKRVLRKHRDNPHNIELLKEYTAHGIRNSAKGHLTTVVELGAQFWGHDEKVLEMLPDEVRHQ
jgi:hypothetical protein